jgi:hypothetical protein
MRKLMQVLVGAAIIAANAAAGIICEVSTIGTTGSGETLYRYNYVISDLTLQRNMEIEFRFDPAVYDKLSNPVAPADFQTFVLQPDNPPGVFGSYNVFSLIDNPPLSGPFTVDFTLDASAVPGSQTFFINLFDDNGNFLRTVDTGRTTSASVIPEPATFALLSTALLAVSVRYAGRRPG